jgi:two-component system, cell cycle sensor histidine kinase and response regulator CckA
MNSSTHTVPEAIRQPSSPEKSSLTTEAVRAKTERLRALGGTETILLVEDDAGLLHLIGRVLAAYGYAVLAARDAEDALAIDAGYAGTIHMLLTDMVMPGLNGPGLAQFIVARRPGVVVLFISGYADEHTIDRLERNSNSRFLAKPFTPESLATHVRQCFDRQASTGVSA